MFQSLRACVQKSSQGDIIRGRGQYSLVNSVGGGGGGGTVFSSEFCPGDIIHFDTVIPLGHTNLMFCFTSTATQYYFAILIHKCKFVGVVQYCAWAMGSFFHIHS